MNGIPMPVNVRTGQLIKPRLEVYYPVVWGMANLPVQHRINAVTWAWVNRLIEEQGFYENPRTTILGTYAVKTNERGVYSEMLTNLADFGGAHPMTLQKSLTMSTETGHVYQLSELFKPNSNYVLRLSKIVEAQIIARQIPLLGKFKGIRPDQDYYIADKCLVIYFQLYEITPYVVGFPYFPISVYEIQDIIREDGPLGQMMW